MALRSASLAKIKYEGKNSRLLMWDFALYLSKFRNISYLTDPFLQEKFIPRIRVLRWHVYDKIKNVWTSDVH